MKKDLLQEILSQVQRPSRYIGNEVNSIKKDHSKVKLLFALAFPDLYEIGTSHFGMQILYTILNQQPEIAAERVFAPDIDMEEQLRANNLPLFTLESKKPLNKFDIIGFSLLYELNYTNILSILDLAQIPFFSKDRDSDLPIIIAGGPTTSNPEPVADFFDAIVIGDGEEVVLQLSFEWMKWKENFSNDKNKLLNLWSKIDGIYIPTLNNKVKRAIVPDLENCTVPKKPIVPFGMPIHDRLRVEIARGCSAGCRFCQAGIIYRPVRERSVDFLLKLLKESIISTGYEDISLLSLSTGNYTCIENLINNIMTLYKDKKKSISLPSLRVGTLSEEMIKSIKSVRKTGFTIAPEAATQRLRNVINKKITEQEIINTAKSIYNLDWKLIKLYFMIGLPTETEKDIIAIRDLAKKIALIKKNTSLNISISTFVPKAHTPFQWEKQISFFESNEKIKFIKDLIKDKRIRLKWQNPEASCLEGVFARGDRKLSKVISIAYAKGCKFDGWTDKLKFNLWQQAFEDENLDLFNYSNNLIKSENPLPWNNIDVGISKEFLIQEREQAQNEQITLDCNKKCNSCGVCDFKKISPKIKNEFYNKSFILSSDVNNKIDNTLYLVNYTKLNDAKFFGHLEFVNIIKRALDRANIDVAYSEGFHPMPKIIFNDPLPIGIESRDEKFYLKTKKKIDPVRIKNLLNINLPDFIKITNCNYIEKINKKTDKILVYKITLKDFKFCDNKLNKFLTSKDFFHTKKNHKGNTREINLKKIVKKIKKTNENNLLMIIYDNDNLVVRPQLIIKVIFDITDEILKQSKIIKLKEF